MGDRFISHLQGKRSNTGICPRLKLCLWVPEACSRVTWAGVISFRFASRQRLNECSGWLGPWDNLSQHPRIKFMMSTKDFCSLVKGNMLRLRREGLQRFGSSCPPQVICGVIIMLLFFSFYREVEPGADESSMCASPGVWGSVGCQAGARLPQIKSEKWATHN